MSLHKAMLLALWLLQARNAYYKCLPYELGRHMCIRTPSLQQDWTDAVHCSSRVLSGAPS